MGCGISQMNIKTGLFEKIQFVKATKLDRNKYQCRIPLVFKDERDRLVELAILGRVREDINVPQALEKYKRESLFEGQIGFRCGDNNTPVFRIDPENTVLNSNDFTKDRMIYIYDKSTARLGNLNCEEFSVIHDSNKNVIANIYEALNRISDLKKLIDEGK